MKYCNPRKMGWIGVVASPQWGGICLLFLFLAVSTPVVGQNASLSVLRKECVASRKPLQTIQGVIRKAGSSYFIKDEKWHWLAKECNGRNSPVCKQEHPELQTLKLSLGKTVEAKLCDGRVVQFRLDDQTFLIR